MSAELVALTAELKSVQLLLGQLLKRLDESDQRARDLQRSHDKLTRVVRWRRVESAVLILAVIALSVVAVDAYNARSRLCRAQEKIVEALVSQAGPNPDQETQARIDEFRADALVDCS